MPTSPKTLGGKRRAILNGTYNGTTLSAEDLMENTYGRVVSKKASSAGKKKYKASSPTSGLKGWIAACKKAEKKLGFWPVPVQKGTEFYNLTRKYYDAM